MFDGRRRARSGGRPGSRRSSSGARIVSLPPRSPPVRSAAPILPGVLPLVLGALQPLELLQHLAPALRLLGLLPGDVAADEVLGLVDVLLLPLVRGARPLEPRVALDDVLVVAARVADELARPRARRSRWHTARMNARSCDTSTKAPGYSARKLSRRSMAAEIEVVGRLVEQQQIRLLHQHLGQLQAAALAARQRVDRARRDRPRRSRRRRQALDARLELVAALALVALLQLAVARQRPPGSPRASARLDAR